MLLPPHPRSYYRAAATRFALGAKARDAQTRDEGAAARRANILASEHRNALQEARTAVVQWAQPRRTCREAQKEVELALVRTGHLASSCTVEYQSRSGTATEGVDFVAARGAVVFLPGQTLASIKVGIIDDEEEEDDEYFTVHLHQPSAGCEVGPCAVCEVTIEDDDGPGELHFESRELEVFESQGSVTLTVMRTHGNRGRVACMWATRDGAATSPADYRGGEGRLVFHDGVVQQQITIPIVDTGAYHRDDDFHVVLTSPSTARAPS